MAPAYFVYLLKDYCFSHMPRQSSSEERAHGAPKIKDFLPMNFVKLGLIVVAVFAVSFGPFIYMVKINY